MNDLLFLSSGDLLRVGRKIYPQLKRVMKWLALGLALCLLVQGPRYLAEGSFRQSFSRGDQQQSGLKKIFKNMLMQEGEAEALPFMRSNLVLKPVIENLGLQVRLEERGIVGTLFHNAINTLRAEARAKLPAKGSFLFSSVKYTGEEKLPLKIRFTSRDNFELLDHSGLLCKGTINVPVSLPTAQFTLLSIPEKISLHKTYPLTLLPWTKVVQGIVKNLTIKPDKVDKNILYISYSHKDRFVASAVINHLMESYQECLKADNAQIAREQLAYLEQRQEELEHKLNVHLEQQAAFLQKSLREKGGVALIPGIKKGEVPRENAYVERLFDIDLELSRLSAHNNVAPSQLTKDFSGINLDTAQKLYVDYTHQLDGMQTLVHQLVFFREQMDTPDFELSSLSSLLSDPVTHDLVQRTAQLSIQLQDQDNRSAKEQERLKEQLAVSKRFLGQHLAQMEDLHTLRAQLIEKRIDALQAVKVELLKNERTLLQEKLQALRGDLASLPERWARENRFRIEQEVHKEKIEGMTQFTESKLLNYHLFHVESKPLDLSVPPLKPQYPGLLLFSLGGALIGGVGLFSFHLLKGMYKGLPVGEEHLKMHGASVAGPLSSYCEAPLEELSMQDIETLRHTKHFFTQGNPKPLSAALISDKQIAPALATLFAKEGWKVLILFCSFKGTVSPEDIPGLEQWLEGKEKALPVRKGDHFDFIPPGGTSRYAAELLAGERFGELLTLAKKEYDLVLLYSRAPVSFAEAKLLVKRADVSALALREERLEELKPYLSSSVTFLLY